MLLIHFKRSYFDSTEGMNKVIESETPNLRMWNGFYSPRYRRDEGIKKTAGNWKTGIEPISKDCFLRPGIVILLFSL